MLSLESFAAALGVICVALVAARQVANYPFGIASVAIYAIVFFRARLYSDAILQLFFVAANFYGWWNWRRHRGAGGDVTVSTMTAEVRGRWLFGWAVVTVGWGALMYRFTDAAYPWADAGIAIASVVAQWLMAQRKLENWWVWIAVDTASIPLYAAKALSFTTGLYMIYLLLATAGLVAWHRARRLSGPVAA